MRLLDRLLVGGFDTHRAYVPEGMKKWMHSTLESAELVVADNVAAYYAQESLSKSAENKTREIQVSDFPNVMLPFESTFIEMRVRGFPELGMSECGVLATMEREMKVDVTGLSETTAQRTNKILTNRGAEYILTLFFFQYGRSNKRPEWSASFMFPVGVEGQIVPAEEGAFPITGTAYLPQDIPIPPEYGNFEEVQNALVSFLMYEFLAPFFLALSFMHCRNVRTEAESPPPKLSKKHQGRTGKPLLRYHVLHIDHMKQVLEKEGGASSQGLKKALHICRGHFKHYGRDGNGLLFGKHSGTVWVPMHTRGSPEEGIVTKDYEVK